MSVISLNAPGGRDGKKAQNDADGSNRHLSILSPSLFKTRKKFKSKFPELIAHYKQINSLTKYLIRIIGVIILAGMMVGIYEIWF